MATRERFLATIFLGAACSSGTRAAPEARESSPDYVTATEIQATPVSNAYDLIQRLRPNWLRQQGTGSIAGGIVRNRVIVVYLDGSRIGSVDILKSVTASGLRSLRYYDAARASTVLTDIGPDPIAGAIVITTRDAP